MSEEIKPIIKVEVGDSEKSVKGLKQEISDLRDKILNLTKGTDEYNEAVEQLQQNQRDLDNVMALTKKNAPALDGSYDALTQKMSLLKKEWRATADEAKRADLGQQIDEINNQLKEMDASVGNFQRNVGNYVSHWEGMPEVTKDFGAAMAEMRTEIEPTKMKFESVGNIASGLASGFAAAQGAMALLGIESDDFQQTMIKLQGAIALAQGIGGLSGLVEGIGKAKVAFEGFKTTIKSVTAAMSTTGWIAVIMAVITAVTLLVSWVQSAKKSTDEYGLSLKEQKKLNKELASSVGDVYAEYRILQREYENLDSLESKKKWIEENAGAFEALGIAINDVNDADAVFVTQSEAVIAALKARAKAEALRDKYKQELVKAEEKKAELATAPEFQRISTSRPTLPDNLTNLGHTDEDWEYQHSGGYDASGVFVPKSEKAKEYLEQQLKIQEKAIDNEVEAVWGKRMTDAQAEAEKAAKAIKQYQKKDKKDGDKKTKTIDELVNEALERINDIEIEDIPIEVDTNLTLKDDDKKLGLYEKLANGRIAYAERVAQREIDLNNASSLSDEEKAQKELEIRQRLEEEKLRILQEYKAKADSTSDWQSQLALQQDIADQEVAITVAKNEAIIQSEQQRKEKTQKILSDVSAAIGAAAQLTQGIMEIAQAKAEEDGEISEEEAKKIKGLQYATASINMLQGAITAFASAMQLGPILGPILGGVNAAAVIAMGTANLMKIKNTDITGSVSSGAQAAVTPNSNVFGTDIPFSYTRQVTGASEVDALNQDTRVYVLESDITDAVNKQKTRVAEASF